MSLHIVPSCKNLLTQGTLEILGFVASSVMPTVTDSFAAHLTVVQSWVIRHLIIHALITSIHMFFQIWWHSHMFWNGCNKETNDLMYRMKLFVQTTHHLTLKLISLSKMGLLTMIFKQNRNMQHLTCLCHVKLTARNKRQHFCSILNESQLS